MDQFENLELPAGVRRADPADWRQLADIAAEAFHEDPVNNWIFGNPRAIQSAFRVLARDIYTKRGICHLAADQGATMWMDYRAGHANDDMSKMAQWSFMFGQLCHGSKGVLKRATAGGKVMAQKHPVEPHMYLFIIGTRPSARGSGLGKALLTPMLNACDASGTACYLENSNPANHSYYAMQGFETREIFACGEGGPPLEGMWRDPR
ncbi:MAG: GNAT family N-acetyltransferase [Erythrobacter sp.]